MSSETPRLTHVDEAGAARMVDVSAKEPTPREATATGTVLVSAEVVRLLRGDAYRFDFVPKTPEQISAGGGRS